MWSKVLGSGYYLDDLSGLLGIVVDFNSVVRQECNEMGRVKSCILMGCVIIAMFNTNTRYAPISIGKRGISIKAPPGSPPAVRKTAMLPPPLACKTMNPPSPEGIIRGKDPGAVSPGSGITGRNERLSNPRIL
jgi:hypothetical protein